MRVADTANREHSSLQKGYISAMLLSNAKMWAEISIWKTMDDALQNAASLPAQGAACAYMASMGKPVDAHLYAHFSVREDYRNSKPDRVPGAVEFSYYPLKKQVNADDFLNISDRFNASFLLNQPGYVSRKLLQDGDMWADMVLWESVHAVKEAIRVAPDNDAAADFLGCIALNRCRTRLLDVRRRYEAP